MKFPEECNKYEKIVVTRHKQLIDYLKAKAMIDENIQVFSHVTIKDIKGKHVIGILPFHLACHAAFFTEVPLRIPYDKKNEELSVDEISFYMQEPKTYTIREIK